MNTNIKIYPILLTTALLVLGTSSCKKYLEAKQSTGFAIPNGLRDAQELVDQTNVMYYSLYQYGEGAADNYYISQTAFDALSGFGLANIRLYYWDENFYEASADVSDLWSNAYNAIMYTNVSLEALSPVERNTTNQEAYDNCKGQALFLRGYFSWKLVTTYAKAFNESSKDTDLGIVIRLKSDPGIVSVRSSVGESYKQVIKDLSEAARLLSNHPVVVQRPSRQAAYGALAEVYLSMNDYTNAGLYADSCLQLGNELINYNEINVNSSAPFAIKNREIIMDVMAQKVLHNKGYYSIDTTLYRSYEDNDLRKKAFYTVLADNSIFFKGNYTTTGNRFGGLAVDEIYLIRAEAYAKAGKLNEAVDDVNTLLKNRYATGTFQPFKVGNADEVLALVRSERRKETVFRDLRWTDIKRMNQEGANISIKRILNGKEVALPPNDNRFALAIPPHEVQLSSIQQNPR